MFPIKTDKIIRLGKVLLFFGEYSVMMLGKDRVFYKSITLYIGIEYTGKVHFIVEATSIEYTTTFKRLEDALSYYNEF